MTEELEQLLKNLKLRRILEIYDEQLRAADKDDISYSDFVTRLVRAQFQAQAGGRAGMAHPARQSARALDVGNVSLRATTGRESQTDPRFRGAGVHHQGGEYRAGRQDRCRQNRISVRSAAESAGERLSLPVHPRAGSIR